MSIIDPRLLVFIPNRMHNNDAGDNGRKSPAKRNIVTLFDFFNDCSKCSSYIGTIQWQIKQIIQNGRMCVINQIGTVSGNWRTSFVFVTLQYQRYYQFGLCDLQEYM